MRSTLTLLLLFATAAAADGLRAAEVEFARVWPTWRGAEFFDRISEYFDGKENTSGHTLCRSQADARAGYYFLVRLKTPTRAPAGSKFVLNIITPTAPEPKAYTFPVPAAAGDVFDLGLTGTDWAGNKTHPVAWKLELIAADGHSLASAQSFLWSMPEQ